MTGSKQYEEIVERGSLGTESSRIFWGKLLVDVRN